MKLIDIDKAIYRHRLNRVIIGFIASLSILSIIYGAMLIATFAGNAEQASNFKFNFIGVILALLTCAAGLHQLKSKEYFREIYYVWQLKQIQNLIYRKLKRIKNALKDDDINAMIILNYYYQSLKQVYLLDDNTLTISTLNNDQEKLNELIANKNISISTEQFDKSMLTSY